MNCQEALSLLYDILDKEASEIDVDEVRSHLKKCGHCSEIYRLEEAVQKFLDEKLAAQKNGPEPKLDDLKAKVVAELDRHDQGPPSRGARRPFDLAAKTLVAAASLVLLLTAAFYISSHFQHYRDFSALESTHFKVADNPAEFDNPNHTSTARRFVNDSLAYDVADQVGQFRLLGGDVVSLNDIPTGHFVYSSGDQTISVFICDCRQRAVPDDAREHAVQLVDAVVYDHVCSGCRLCFYQHGRALIVSACSDTTVDLHQFRPGHPTGQLTAF